MSKQPLDVAIAAIESSRKDLVEKEDQRVAVSKGKSRATQEDEDRDANYRKGLEEYDWALSELRAARQKQTQEAEAKILEKDISGKSPRQSDSQGAATEGTTSADRTLGILSDTEPYLNPFTGSYIFPETGFEAGPSSKNQLPIDVPHFSVPPPKYSLEDNLISNFLPEPNHELLEQDLYVDKRIHSTRSVGGYEREEVEDGNTKPSGSPTAAPSNVKPSIIRGIGSIVGAFESWITPKINKALHGSPSSLREQQNDGTQEHRRRFNGALGELGNKSTISDSSLGMTSYDGAMSMETLRSTSTAPSSICSEQSGRQDMSRRPKDQSYRPNIPSIKEIDHEELSAPARGLGDTLEGRRKNFCSTSGASHAVEVDGARFLADENADPIVEEPATRTASYGSGGTEKKNLDEDSDDAMQIQKERELADQEAAAEAQRSHDQLVRMQREFDEEATRLRADRQMALEYARGLEEAMRVDDEIRTQEALLLQDLALAQRLQATFQKEEARKQQDYQAAADFARSLEEADLLQHDSVAAQMAIEVDRAYAAQLRDEEHRFWQSDHDFAEQIQAEMEKDATFDPDSSQPPHCPDQSTASRLQSPPLPFHRFPSLENINGSARGVARSGRLTSSIPNRTQKPAKGLSHDRAAAQALFEEERKRYAEANERWKRDIQAWQADSDAQEAKARRSAEAVAAKQDQLKSAQRRSQAPRTANERPEVVAARTSVERDVADCGICVEPMPKARLVRPCKHFYCRQCLAEWFQRALREKPKKQPRCCNRILPISLVSQQLGEKFMVTWRLFELETTTPNPLYCSNGSCTAFIEPRNVHGDIGTCKCRARTCRHCRNKAHPGKLCAADEDTQKVKTMAKKEGWRYCPKCKHLIERTAGCLHMTCSQCRTEFCWKCGKTSCKGYGAC